MRAVRHFATATIAALVSAPLSAGPQIRPIEDVKVQRLHYAVKTGKVTSVASNDRYGHAVWSCPFDYVSYFWGAEPELGEMGLDWADVAAPVAIGGLTFVDYTNSQAADGDCHAIIAIYAEEDGWNSIGRSVVAAYRIDNIPGQKHPTSEPWAYIWNVEIDPPFVLDGSDLDGDGLTDWGYAQFFSVATPGALHGPAICGLLEPNNLPPECPGVEDVFDLFIDPNWNDDPYAWLDDDPNLQNSFAGTYWFGGGPPVFAQFCFELFAYECPSQGTAGRYCSGDIDGSFDCLVGLPDLTILLGNYGMTTGATPAMGDLEPYDYGHPGDGDVDLGDLSELLSQYGDDCSGP